jgi:hypothetical protein
VLDREIRTGGQNTSVSKPEAPEWPADHVERWPLSRLVPYAGNARLHSKQQIAQIAAAITQWGWTNPILVDETGGIIAGHGRVLAARELGLDEAPVMVARGWSKAQRRAYVLADNQLALSAGWDEALLAAELRGLDEAGFDLALVGFSAEELGDIMLSQDAAPKSTGLGDPIIQYNIVFDDEGQQQAWFSLLRRLRTRRPDLETIGARLAAHIAEIEEADAEG